MLRDFFLNGSSMAESGYCFFTGLGSNRGQFFQFEAKQ
ncbi:hypothetical protein SAMN05444398_1144 [Roseovarius pacificus]|uniref:Uncharacterized protein n=1 Tax=Roseovarius pacificus TaxID=337701 RepID=A0A1M7HX30_9RHOB|nr:hypothetical protein SAMN05444398_1144 [Roseovarius pacificus]